MRARALSVLLLAATIMWEVPVLGLALAGRAYQSFLAFPPRTRALPHPPFDWVSFAVVALPLVAVVALYWRAIANARPGAAVSTRHHFPWWGWVGLGLVAASWVFAWHESFVPAPWRRHVFAPLWLGYILLMNGLTLRRTGWSPLTHRSRWFVALFPVSGVFWWLFEHLNRFVANWYYSGVEASGDWDYFVQTTPAFCTVLPAIASTWAWLATFPRLNAMNLPGAGRRIALAWPALAAGLLALACIGIWPNVLFPALWLAPLLVIGALQQLLVGDTLFASLRHGDWRPLLQPALAALICGLLWELWNFGSLAKWHYSIPYVQRFHVFEMPLLGYAGYLPFGVECALVMDLVARCIDGRKAWPLRLR